MGFIDSILAGKKLTDYTIDWLFSPHDFKINDNINIILPYFKNESM